MSTAARKERKRLREPYSPPEDKVPTPLMERTLSTGRLVSEIRARGLEKEFLALAEALDEAAAAQGKRTRQATR